MDQVIEGICMLLEQVRPIYLLLLLWSGYTTISTSFLQSHGTLPSMRR